MKINVQILQYFPFSMFIVVYKRELLNIRILKE